MMSKLTAEEAHKKLSSIHSQEEFKKLIINDLSVEVVGKNDDAKTLLYSGEITRGDTPIDTSAIAASLKENPKFRLLDNTEADRFLSSMYIKEKYHPDYKMGRDLRDKLEKLFGGNPLDYETPSPSNTYVNQTHGGAWDTVSANFISETKGEVVTLAGDTASVKRIFFETEIPGAKANPNITHIDHVEKDTLFKKLEALGDPQHQLNHFKTITYTREEVFNILKQESNNLIHHPAEVIPRQIESVLGSKNHYGPAIQDRIDTFKLESFTKAEVSKASGIDHDTISDTQIKTFLSSQTPKSKEVLDTIENHRHTLSQHNPRMQHFDIYSHGKYAILGGVAGTILATEQADASTIPNPHLPKDSFENLSTHEKIGAELSAGFNAINAIQASEEFKAGASKSAKVLLDPRAYKQGIEEATQAWKPNPTQEVVKLSTMESAKFAGKSALKKLPLIGLGAGIAFGIGRAMDGDFNGAAMEIASGAASIVPGWGTAASVGIDAALLEKDTHLLSHGVDKIIHNQERQQAVTVASEDNHSTKAPSQAR